MIVTIALASCTPEDQDRQYVALPPDASSGDADDAACPDGLITWRDVLTYWDEVRCTAIARCFPETFAAWYGDQAGCVAQLGAWHCIGGTPTDWCDGPYPRARCATLLACQADAEALACDPEAVVPASCEDALR